MKDLLIRLLVAAAATLVLILASSAHGQNADTSLGFTQHPEVPERPSHPQQQGNSSSSPSSETQTQDIHSFIGHIAKEDGQIILKDPVTKMSYRLDDPSKARQYIGRQVKVTGRLGLDSNTIYIENIEPRS